MLLKADMFGDAFSKSLTEFKQLVPLLYVYTQAQKLGQARPSALQSTIIFPTNLD